MNKIGTVSEINGGKARVTLEDMDNTVTDWLPINSMKSISCTLGATCTTQTNILIGSKVLVCFYNENFKDGVIVAKVE